MIGSVNRFRCYKSKELPNLFLSSTDVFAVYIDFIKFVCLIRTSLNLARYMFD